MTQNMLRVAVVASGVMLGACEQAPPEVQLVHRAAEAMGGLARVLETENLVITGDGREYRLGQNVRPAAALPYWEIDEFTRTVNLTDKSWRLTERRSSAFLTGNPVSGQERTLGVAGDVAYDILEDGTAQRASATAAAERMVTFYHHPVALVQLALAEGLMVGNLRPDGALQVVDITSAAGDLFELSVDAESGEPTRIVSASYHPTLGDVTVTSRFANYQETGGRGGFSDRLTLPRRLSVDVDDRRVWEATVRVEVDQAIGDVGAPAEASASPPLVFTAAVEVEELADGVWRLGGQSHHSVVVELDEFLVLVEAPQHDARTLAVIAEARALRPDKPLQYVVNTHHHLDHSGGIRAAVSEGLTVITYELNREFIEALVARAHTRHPDALAGNPQPLTLETVDGRDVRQLGEGRRTIELMRIIGDEHSAGLLMVYLPRQRLLIEADAFTPGSRAAPFAANLLRNIEDRNLRVNQVVPLHGDVVDLAALEDAVAG